MSHKLAPSLKTVPSPILEADLNRFSSSPSRPLWGSEVTEEEPLANRKGPSTTTDEGAIPTIYFPNTPIRSY